MNEKGYIITKVENDIKNTSNNIMNYIIYSNKLDDKKTDRKENDSNRVQTT